MNFEFDKELKELKDFYDYTVELYKWRASAPGGDTVVISSGNPKREEVLRKAILAMMCGSWETLESEAKREMRRLRSTGVDVSHIQVLFPSGTKWIDGRVNEIAQIRHCILHRNGIIDDDYLRFSKNVFGYKVGDEIKLDDKMDKFFVDIGDAFSELKAKAPEVFVS